MKKYFFYFTQSGVKSSLSEILSIITSNKCIHKQNNSYKYVF